MVMCTLVSIIHDMSRFCLVSLEYAYFSTRRMNCYVENCYSVYAVTFEYHSVLSQLKAV